MSEPALVRDFRFSRLRVLLADDSTTTRQRLRVVLECLAFVEVVGEACNCDTTVELFLQTSPDAVVAAISLPKGGGFHVLRSIKRASARCAVILTSRAEDPFVAEASRLLGAAGLCRAADGFTGICELLKALACRCTN